MTQSTTPAGQTSSDLRIAFFSDSLPERNGTGAYYHDLLAHLRDRVAAAEALQPRLQDGLEAISMRLPGDPTQRIGWPAPFRIRRAMAALRPHVVVSVTPGPFGLLGERLAHHHGAGFVTAYHTDFAALANLYWGPLRRGIGNRMLEGLNRRLCRRSDTVLVTNSGLVDTVRRLGALRVDVMGTPIASVFLATTPPAAPQRPDPVVFAGRLAAEKNIDALLSAARARPGQRFIIAGDGPQRAAVAAAARELDNLDYRGWLSRHALCDLLDEAGLLVLPSHFETFGSIALEALARRRPVLVSANAGIHDWPQVADGLCPLAPDERLEDALARLAAEAPSDWAARGERGRAGALRFHHETLEQWLAVLTAHARGLG
ncbi:glycosyltransferase [Arhodomonas sp. SL1]|uniref:glycosyltransferase n=1 Tax=Arhodomonas sp. SL1 TaxID=3425691 RepID=UPI003F8835D1